MNFPTDWESILSRVDAIEPVNYGKTRNYIDGKVTQLSPYISRGVISTKFVVNRLFQKGWKAKEIEGLIQQLTWRDYFQRVWQRLEIDPNLNINSDIYQVQEKVRTQEIPNALVEAQTSIAAIDKAIIELYSSGYMHNHLRMYVAALSSNIGQTHWKLPAQWMYYHLLDADWASNALSWQWVAGTFSKKKYVANQSNINKFTGIQQKSTYLDIEYEDFAHLDVPKILQETTIPSLKTKLPKVDSISINVALPIYVYTFYNLDPYWDKDTPANRILLLEPSHFEQYPISEKTMNFTLELAKNIANIQIFVGEFREFIDRFKVDNIASIHFKEHPTNNHFRGILHERDWIFPTIKESSGSFFKYWKMAEKEIAKRGEFYFE